MFHSHAHRVDFEKLPLCQQYSLCGSYVYGYSHKVRRSVFFANLMSITGIAEDHLIAHLTFFCTFDAFFDVTRARVAFDHDVRITAVFVSLKQTMLSRQTN